MTFLTLLITFDILPALCAEDGEKGKTENWQLHDGTLVGRRLGGRCEYDGREIRRLARWMRNPLGWIRTVVGEEVGRSGDQAMVELDWTGLDGMGSGQNSLGETAGGNYWAG